METLNPLLNLEGYDVREALFAAGSDFLARMTNFFLEVDSSTSQGKSKF